MLEQWSTFLPLHLQPVRHESGRMEWFVLAVVLATTSFEHGCPFPHNLTGLQCVNLKPVAKANTPNNCQSACCSNPGCTVLANIGLFEAKRGHFRTGLTFCGFLFL
jgi:hypothetical protein